MATQVPHRTIVYVDGFNLYYGELNGTPYKWLDLGALFHKVLGPQNHLVRIKYFTALVQPTPRDQSVHVRQAAYLGALRALSAGRGSPRPLPAPSGADRKRESAAQYR